MNKKIYIAVTLLLLFMMISCFASDDSSNIDYRSKALFKNTPCWELRKAIDKEDTTLIRELCLTDSSLLNFQEKRYCITPLIRAAGRQKKDAVECLLKSGADPNLNSTIGINPLFESLTGGWEDSPICINIDIVKLLLKYGADPNYRYHVTYDDFSTDINVIEDSVTPLMYVVLYNISSDENLDVVKVLVENGADIDCKSRSGKTASIYALIAQDIKSAYYLIVEKNAKISDPFYYYSDDGLKIDYDKPRFAVDLLLNLTYELDTKEYELKKKVIERFNQQGISYASRKTNIPKHTLSIIKKRHPNDWEEYIRHY